MKHSRVRTILPVLAAFLLLITSAPAYAAGETVIDWTKKGSVSVSVKEGDTAISGAEFTLYQVADAQTKDSNLCYAFTAAFQGFGGTPDELKGEAAVQRLAAYAEREGVAGIAAQTNQDGYVRFDELPLGLYLVVQTGSVPGFSACTPFLISLPVVEDNQWVYDIDATPKTDVVRLIDITVKKVWNDDGKGRPGSVTVQLQHGDTVVDTVTLNDQNNWSYTWTGQPKSDTWSVKEMDVPKGYTASYAQNGFVYTITNSAALIHTGQLKWLVPALAGAGALLFAGGWLLHLKGKRNHHA